MGARCCRHYRLVRCRLAPRNPARPAGRKDNHRRTTPAHWAFLDNRFASVCAPGAGQPGLPTRLVAGLFILKHMHDLSDEVLCARWLENPYYQFF